MSALHDIVQKGATDRSVTLHIMDSTDGTPETGVVFNTSGIDLWYRREGAAKTSITEATLAALTTAHTDGGFLHISDGDYRLDLPDAAFATGANHVDFGGTVTGMIVVGGRVRLVDYNLEVNFSTNAAPGASGGLLISGSNSGTTTLGALTITGATTHTGATAYTGAVTMAAGLAITQSTSNASAFSAVGNGTGHGISATSGSGATGNGINAAAASTNGNGVNFAGTGTGSGERAVGGATGQGVSMVGGATSGLGLGISYTAPIGACAELGIAESGTLQSATATTAVLRSATSFADDLVIGMTLAITGGTGAGQSRLITDWVSATDTATVETWTTTPDNTSLYEVYRTAAGSGGSGLDAAGVRAAIGMASADLDTQLDAIKSDTAATLVDTAEIGTAGAGLTNINLPNQTMDIVGNITGNLSGSVGSVTGAVGSVTGAVGSVTGLTAADVGAIKTKTDSLTFTKANEIDANIQSLNGVTLTGDGSGSPFAV